MPLVALQPVTCSKCPAFYQTKLQDQRGYDYEQWLDFADQKFFPAPGTVKIVLDIRFHSTGLLGNQGKRVVIGNFLEYR